MRVEGFGDPAPETRIRMQADSRTVRDAILRVLSQPPLSMLRAEDRGTAEIVLAEVLNNVVEHAYAQGSGPILLTLSLGDNVLHCQVEDEGTAMPAGQPPDGCPPDPSDLPEGGFGWHLIRTLCQKLRYERADGLNRLSFSLPAERSRS